MKATQGPPDEWPIPYREALSWFDANYRITMYDDPPRFPFTSSDSIWRHYNGDLTRQRLLAFISQRILFQRVRQTYKADRTPQRQYGWIGLERIAD